MNELELKNQIESAVNQQIIVTNAAEYESAGQFLRNIKTNIKQVDEFFEPMRKASYDALQVVYDKINEFKKPLLSIEKTAKKAMGDFAVAEQARIAKEEETRRKEAEELMKLSSEAMEQGDQVTGMEAILLASEEVNSVKPMATAQGVSNRFIWRAKVVDQAKVPEMFKTVNVRAVEDFAKSFKGDAPTVPGIVFEKEIVISARSF